LSLELPASMASGHHRRSNVPPTLSLLTLVGILALSGLTLLLWIAWGAFEDRPARGALALFVPGYALWYGWTRFSHPRRHGIVIVAFMLLVLAGLGALLASTLGYETRELLAR
jgi:hypothetical protein